MNILIISALLIFTGTQDSNTNRIKTSYKQPNIGVIDVSKDTTFKKKTYNVRTVKKDSVAKKTPIKTAPKSKGVK